MTKNVFVIGHKFWARRLQQVLAEYGGSCLRVRCRQVPGGAGQIGDCAHLFGTDVFFRVGMRPGSRTIRGRAFDAFWHTLRLAVPRAAVVYYWIGTDVLKTLETVKRGGLSKSAMRDVRRSLHVADAQWLADELRILGIEALVQRLPGALTRPDKLQPLPETFRVLTYIPDARHEFYGGAQIYEAARALPSIPFDVVGGTGSWIARALPNLVFHGWQGDLAAFYRNSSVVARLVKHDGLGATAVEGLLFGRHVLYTYPLPYTISVAFGDTGRLIEILRSLRDQFQRGSLGPNTAGHEWATKAFDASAEGGRLVDIALNSSARATL